MWYESKGVLKYSYKEPYGYRLVLEIDPEISLYYWNMIPKAIRADLNRPMYAPHISIVRKQVPTKLANWGIYEGKSIDFSYGNLINTDGIYWWNTARGLTLEELRLDLGLENKKREGEAFYNFHITIANAKSARREERSDK